MPRFPEGDSMAFVRDGRLFGKLHYAFVIMVGCCFLQAFGMGLLLACGSLFYVPVCDDLGFLRSEISTYMTGYFVGTTIATPIAGKLLSRFNIRIVMSIAIVALSGTFAAMSTFQVLWQFQLAGFMVGTAGSCIFVLPAATLVGNWFIRRRGMFYGIAMACSGVSTALFSPAINAIIEASGWRSAYIVMGVISFAVIFPCIFLFRLKPSDMRTTPWGYSANPQNGSVTIKMRGVSVKKAVFSISFLCLFVFAGVASFCHGGIEQHMPGYIVSLGFSSSFAAMVVSAESIGSVFDKLIMGWLNDKVGVQRTALIQLSLIIVGLLGFILIKDPIVLLLSAAVFGVQDSLMSVSVPLLIREIFGSKNYTQIHAWIRTGVGVFGAFSGVVVGGVYDITGQFTAAFLFIIGLCAIGIVLIALAYRFKRRLVWDEERDLEGQGKRRLVWGAGRDLEGQGKRKLVWGAGRDLEDQGKRRAPGMSCRSLRSTDQEAGRRKEIHWRG